MGINVGNPVTLANGQAAVTTTINGDSGSQQSDCFLSRRCDLYGVGIGKHSDHHLEFRAGFAGATAAVGSAAIAPVTVNVANNYTTPISLTCTMPVHPDAIGMLCES